jgi:hypothetical protein
MIGLRPHKVLHIGVAADGLTSRYCQLVRTTSKIFLQGQALSVDRR